ncbi:hypothetical protein E3N88_01738 [Mikania micrantha]|uniref:Serine-threonine/tyrosine-protein kinase catalytic domain-containing protein n=1 Tax=Mikania micrantha TaxID=192012 RepID=A0A5N6Q217_9ASTR|nr:hypothetical protein E3N88_01738 [Mikania micrantha]
MMILNLVKLAPEQPSLLEKVYKYIHQIILLPISPKFSLLHSKHNSLSRYPIPSKHFSQYFPATVSSAGDRLQESLENKKVIEIEDEDDEEQSSPRGVLEITVSGSDSDNHSIASRCLSSRGSSFNEKSTAIDGDANSATGGDEDIDGGGAGLISTSSADQALRWRNLICNLKWKSFKRFSTVPLVAGYELSKKSLMRRLGKHNNDEVMIDGVNWVVPKPSWRNFTLEELAAATDNFAAGKILFAGAFPILISDFGLAKWLPEKWVHHVVSPIEGTFGYMAPEYFMHELFMRRLMCFSFGVLLLELITGRRAVDSSRQSLVIWAKPHLEQGNVKELVDPCLEINEYELVELKRAMSAASACIHHLPHIRPSMKRIPSMVLDQRLPGNFLRDLEGRNNLEA